MSPSTTSNAGTSSSTLVAWGRLLRLSLAPTAAADIVAGAVCAARGWPEGGGLWLVVAGSLCVYHGGMALNDWADREHDTRTRPERPIPSGALEPRSALVLALALLVLGPALAALVSLRAGALLAGVALLAGFYDVAGRGAWSGPLLLGLCRAGNLGTGMVIGGLATTAGGWLIAGYGAYVFLVSRLGRMEDGAQERIGQRPRYLLLAAALCQLVPLCFAPVPLAPLALLRIVWLAWRPRTWSPATILPAMGSALRLLLVYSASVAWIGGGAWIALGILLVGYPLAWVLRQVFPPS